MNDTRRARKGRTCEVCASTYNASYADQRTCGRSCGSAIWDKQAIASAAAKRRTIWPTCSVYIRTCPGCLDLFTAPTRRREFCSDRCWQRINRPYDPHPCITCGSGELVGRGRTCPPCQITTRAARKQRGRQIRRARKRGAYVELVSLLALAKRDRYRCGICGERVAMTKRAPHPRSPSLDHIVPLAAGGEHSRANCQLAHLLCNSTKGARGTQQLALIG